MIPGSGDILCSGLAGETATDFGVPKELQKFLDCVFGEEGVASL